MHQTTAASLKFLVDHLRWCLAQPLAGESHEWAERVRRAVDHVEKAFVRHIEHVEAPGGPLDEIADPGQFPFTAAAQQVRALRRQHTALRTQIHCVSELFRDCLLLFGPATTTAADSIAVDSVAEARALRLFAILAPRVSDLVNDLEHHLAAEDALLTGSDLDGYSIAGARSDGTTPLTVGEQTGASRATPRWVD
jgi:hypothetical protein